MKKPPHDMANCYGKPHLSPDRGSVKEKNEALFIIQMSITELDTLLYW